MSEVHAFPAHRIVRTPGEVREDQLYAAPDLELLGDRVAVVHLGVVRIYDTPQDLHAAVLVACADQLEAAEDAAARRAVADYKLALAARRGDGLMTAFLCGVAFAAVLLAVFR